MSTSEGYELVAEFASLVMDFQEPALVWPAMLMKLQDAIDFDAGYIAASWGNATEGRGAVADHDEPSLKRNLGRYLAEITPEEVALYTDRARVHHEIWSRNASESWRCSAKCCTRQACNTCSFASAFATAMLPASTSSDARSRHLPSASSRWST